MNYDRKTLFNGSFFVQVHSQLFSEEQVTKNRTNKPSKAPTTKKPLKTALLEECYTKINLSNLAKGYSLAFVKPFAVMVTSSHITHLFALKGNKLISISIGSVSKAL